MPEINVEDIRKKGWVYVGRKANGEVKFRKYTEQSLEHVKSYLDLKGISYVVYEKPCLIFIYKEKDPVNEYRPRYSYYYTTGQWGDDKRRKHYHSDGIEHFISTYFKTLEEDKAYWDSKNGVK